MSAYSSAETPPELDRLVGDYLAASNGALAYPLKDEVLAAVTALDRFYWDEVQRRVVATGEQGGADLRFSDEDRLLIDFGLLDPRLLPGADEAFITGLREAMAAEHERVLYMTQWLAMRYRKQALLHELDEDEDEDDPEGLGGAGMAAAAPASLHQRLVDARVRVYSALRPLFQTLPGVTPEVVELICSGKLDLEMERLWLELQQAPDAQAMAQLNKYQAFRDGIFERMRTHASRSQHLQHLDSLRKFGESIRLELAAGRGQARRTTKRTRGFGLPQRQAKRFLSGEIKLIRMLLQLGTTDAGIRRSHSVLLVREALVTPEDITAALGHAREADPRLPLDLTFLIAPYTGAGFFEWDRDTIVIPLVAMKGKEESVVGGLATYRILIDKLQEEGKLIKDYSEMRGVSGSAMRDAFIRDYRHWVTKTCRGWRGGMERKVYDFFKQRIGPRPDSIVVPIELIHLTRKETIELLKFCRKRINAGEADWDDYYYLAVAYWNRGNVQQAYENLQAAVKINPNKGMLLFSLGVLSYKLEIPLWSKFFKACSALAPNSIWQVYAKEYLSEG